MAGLDSNRGAKRGREARAQMGLDPRAPVPCLLDVVEDRAKVPVVVASLQDGLAGACVPIGPGRLLFVNGTQPSVRQRFTLAHELGHVWCRHDGQLAVDTVAMLSGRTTNSHEVQANAFAAEFLIPKEALAAVADRTPTFDEVLVVAAHYGTSALMTLYRFRQVGLIAVAACDAIKAQLQDGAHFDAYERLGLTPLPDRLEVLEGLPYLSPALAGTQLGAAVRGEAAAEPQLAMAISRLLAPPA